ncbi:hypothetical protein T439DRAFT_212462 [Meredithblackwellia eburnea MCA 4105]
MAVGKANQSAHQKLHKSAKASNRLNSPVFDPPLFDDDEDNQQHQKQKQQRQKPPKHGALPPSSASAAAGSKNSLGGRNSQAFAMDEDDEEEDDETDEDDSFGPPSSKAGGQHLKKKLRLKSSSVGKNGQDVEDLCAGCRGQCVCGGARGASVFQSLGGAGSANPPQMPFGSAMTLPTAAGGLPLKVKLSMGSTGLPSPSPPPPSLAEKEKKRSHKKKLVSLNPATSTVPNAPSKPGAVKKGIISEPPLAVRRGRPRKHEIEPAGASPSSRSSSNNSDKAHAPLTTPSRMSLRQVLAASIKEAEQLSERENSPSVSNIPEFVDASSLQKKKSKQEKKRKAEEKRRKEQREQSKYKENLDDVSELDLDSEMDGELDDEDDDDDDSGSEDGSEGENAIERREEAALRKEFEKAAAAAAAMAYSDAEDDDETESDDDSVDSFDEDGDLSSSFAEEDEGREARRRRARSANSSFENSEEDGETYEEDPETFGGGRGVVTWSDYGDASDEDEDDDDDEDMNGDAELVEVKVNGTKSKHPETAGEFEDELEELLALSEAVVGPVRDGEYEFGEMWFEEVSNAGDDEGVSDGEGDSYTDHDETIIIVDGTGWHHERRESTDESAGDSDATEEGEMDWTSQSEGDIYGGDNINDGDTTDSLDSEADLVRFGIEVDSEAETSSTSESEDPTSTVVDSHPSFLALKDVQAPTLAEIASGAIRNVVTPGAYLGSQQFSEGNNVEDEETADDEDEDEEEEDFPRKRRSPAMGLFGTRHGRKRAAELVVVIDESNTVAPSPFSQLKRGKKRGRHLLDGSPSRGRRADSKVSTASGPSVTDGSLSGEPAEMQSPFPSVDALMDFDIDDVLHASLLEQGGSTNSSDSEGEGETAGGLSDLSRWNRIPIGAFRSSTMPSSADQIFGPSPSQEHHRHLYLPVAASLLRGDQKNKSSLSRTLSSPHTVTTTRRAIERRMLTSPVFGPAGSSLATVSSPKSHKARRKERKTTSSVTERITSPKSQLRRPAPGSATSMSITTPSSLLVGPPSAQLPSPLLLPTTH